MDAELSSELQSADALQRRSRMARTPTNKRIELSERDLEIFRLLSRYRYLRSTHLFVLAGGKSQKRFIERLGHLYHERGYLNRPSQQWQAINARYMPAVYELGEAGERVLEAQGLTSPLSRKAKHGAIRQFQHELMICDVVSSIEIGTQADPTLRYISWDEILHNPKMPESTRNSVNPLAVPVAVSFTCPRTKCTHRSDKPLIPDALFGIEYTANGRKLYRFFALEADRNTEPGARGNLEQSSYLRKMLQYREVIAQSIYRMRWGIPNLLVLNITINNRHMQNLMKLGEEMTAGKGSAYLLFKTMPSRASLEKAPVPMSQMLTEAWQRIGAGPFTISQP
jgi:hypothetical protein